MYSQKGGFATILVLLVVVLVSGVGVGWYLLNTGVIPKFTGPATTEQPPSPPEVPGEPTTGEAANWQVYTGENFTFKYPQDTDWTVYKGTNEPGREYMVRIACLECGKYYVLNGFSVRKIFYKSLDAYLKSNPHQINTSLDPIDTKEIMINGLKATEVLIPPYQGIGLVDHFLIHNGQAYILTYEAYSTPSNKIKDLPAAQPDILPTFKFLP